MLLFTAKFIKNKFTNYILKMLYKLRLNIINYAKIDIFLPLLKIMYFWDLIKNLFKSL